MNSLCLQAAWVICCASLCLAQAAAQEQVDKLDPRQRGSAAIRRMTIRARVVEATPAAEAFHLAWRRGGEGLGGTVIRGSFAPEGKESVGADAEIAIAKGTWSAWLPLETVVGKAKGWEFPTITVEIPGEKKKKNSEPVQSVVVELQFAESGKVFREWRAAAPKGATIGFAFPAQLLDERGSQNPAFVENLRDLLGHARQRRETLEHAFPDPFAPPQKFAILGHLAGYGEGPGGGLGKAAGYGVRHCDPTIVAEECRTLQLLGMNSLVGSGSLRLADAGGVGKDFRRLYWGGPGSGSPMAGVSSRGAGEPDGCPFDPRLPAQMAESVKRAIAEHQATRAANSWALWWDEIGVAAKTHLNDCPTCRGEFQKYLRQHHVSPQEVGAKDEAEVAPYPLWKIETTNGKTAQIATPPPTDPAQKLRFYYTHRFLTHCTAQLFPASAKALAEAKIPLYAMQGPTPSWAGHSLDWHEFYDGGANTAFVWETSNRDPRVWQLESYLADIMRGIAQRHGGPIGTLVKPHRGAPQQRMLAAVSRGATAIEWYTYGPDYAKGDSFSQSPDLLKEVAAAGRFLAKAEPYLYGAKLRKGHAVAFVSPRSSEIWGRATDLGISAFEDAKWVYLALRHAGIAVDILSEQQLAEGELDKQKYKALYCVGPNLRRDAAAKVSSWVKEGGILWTDCLGLSRNEANEPLAELQEVLGLESRRYESWGTVPPYRAVNLEPIVEKSRPDDALIRASNANRTRPISVSVGREVVKPSDGQPLYTFGNDSPAVIEKTAGKGRVYFAAFWAGLTYSAKVRRADYEMSTDFDPDLRRIIALAATSAGEAGPVEVWQPLVEAVALEKDGQPVVALMNWNYSKAGLKTAQALRIDLPGYPSIKRWKSLVHGDLPTQTENGRPFILLPEMGAIDVLIAIP